MNLVFSTFCLELSVWKPGSQIWLPSPLAQEDHVVWDPSILFSKHLLSIYSVPGPVLETQQWTSRCGQAHGGDTYSRWR